MAGAKLITGKSGAPNEAVIAIVRALARDAALAEYQRQQQQAGSNDNTRGDLRPV